METGAKLAITTIGLAIGLIGGLVGSSISLAIQEALGGTGSSLNVFSIVGFVFGALSFSGAYAKFIGERNVL